MTEDERGYFSSAVDRYVSNEVHEAIVKANKKALDDPYIQQQLKEHRERTERGGRPTQDTGNVWIGPEEDRPPKNVVIGSEEEGIEAVVEPQREEPFVPDIKRAERAYINNNERDKRVDKILRRQPSSDLRDLAMTR